MNSDMLNLSPLEYILKKLRVRKNELAEIAGVSTATISRWCHDGKIPCKYWDIIKAKSTEFNITLIDIELFAGYSGYLMDKAIKEKNVEIPTLLMNGRVSFLCQ